MKYCALAAQVPDENVLKEEYKSAREIGVIRIGEENLYFRKFWKIYYISYHNIHRCFRRVEDVPMKLCCGKGNMGIEYLVICGEKGELAQIELPGTKAARILIKEIEKRIQD